MSKLLSCCCEEKIHFYLLFLAPYVGLLEVCLFESLCSKLRNKLGGGKREIRMKIIPWYLYLYSLGQPIRPVITRHEE